ncbi:hypothetical protein HFO60_10775 [Rhizobium leguminosarum]|uniref:hypothetical protein n=1 Tax=Rhizobium leguminosarum TaxID=384 RepID=UPI001C959E36|nr:hypothetical protein [Rhizobium leguminosarum]MBY5540522.1 hypothetical protein [Rhizobium leguminosarum]
MLIISWFDNPNLERAILDLPGFGDPAPSRPKRGANIFRRLCRFSHQPIVLAMMCCDPLVASARPLRV